ncbi:hypothetical protein [Variovorax atrisoli]|uniref:hypothetical protein n=1 Tax=Variovorax atrisoli TaxID=3394203 RepID=UPI003395E213
MMQITSAQVLAELQHHIGKANGIHVRELVQRITGQVANPDMFQRQVRDIVVELRKQGLHICATPAAGYFMAESAEELIETCVFLYDRAMTTLVQISAMQGVSLPDLRGQLRLPT